MDRPLKAVGLNAPVFRYGLPALLATLAVQYSTKRKRGADEETKSKQCRNNKEFTLMDPDNKTDLGWLAVLSFGLPTIARTIETWVLFRFGLKGILKRGSPKKFAATFVFVIFGLFPTVDLASGDDWTNPTEEQMEKHMHDKKFRWVLYAFTIASLLNTAISVPLMALQRGFSLLDKALLLSILGFKNGAIGITTSHELIHKNPRLEKILGYALLMNTSYCHWALEHTHGHHRTVATRHDPATSRLGESLYSFLLRVIPGTWKSSYNLHKERNGLLQFWACSVGLPLAWALVIGRGRRFSVSARVFVAFYFQAFVGSALLEVVNYLEHYGLLRKKIDNIENDEMYIAKNYELCDPSHSWNSPARMTNMLHFKLQRHSDHHANSKVPYHLLRNFKESPQLPTGYAGMVPLAMCPLAWFNVMDPLVAAVRSDSAQKFEQELEAAKGKLKAFAGVSVVLLFCLVRGTP